MAKKLSRVLPEYILENLRRRWGLTADDTSKDERVDNMGLHGIVENFFAWEGIQGYGEEMVDVVIDTMLALAERGENVLEGYGYKLVKDPNFRG